jgi:hypothetical protein
MEDLVPLIVAVLILAMLFGLVLFVSQVQPAKVLVVAAARNCARAGVETLSAGRGLDQAVVTAVETAGVSDPQGLAINPQGLAVWAYTADWDRGQVFVCETGYNVRVSHLPIVSWFYPKGYVPLRARVALSIEPYKSRWE